MIHELIDRFLHNDEQKYIFGTTSEAKALVQLCRQCNIKLTGIIDNFYPHSDFAGLPCQKLADVSPNSLVLSAVTNSRPIEVAKLLTDNDFEHIDYYSFFRFSGLSCPKIEFWHGAKAHWQANLTRYQTVKNLLEDEQSKETFDAVVAFRNSYDLANMKGFTFDISNMYMESFILPFREHGVFFDLGAFDGTDTRRFLQRCQTGESYLFEPIPEQVSKLDKFAGDNERIHLVPVAVGENTQTVRFCVGGTSSKVLDLDKQTASEESREAQEELKGIDALNGTVEVNQISLDDFYRKHSIIPEYVKMDVEGAEQSVIRGMNKLLVEHKPKLAVSVYHRVEDIIDIPLMIKRANPDYKFYLRHYTQGYSETVLFAV
ncbi:FkbM family methyltransferase [Thalassotalea euphylliae]|uniref:FkbM family methyltransferase n=1 Tax=Thalassotalea euphylliae TaxID=1655234 RepID=A0A3E0UD68_9GAMM|nr:FkbM family methyltransferase [Thalassotalea euphylliae]REL34846.1 FkbM family methyltransferase [Thalassotalea euphylliae]